MQTKNLWENVVSVYSTKTFFQALHLPDLLYQANVQYIKAYFYNWVHALWIWTTKRGQVSPAWFHFDESPLYIKTIVCEHRGLWRSYFTVHSLCRFRSFSEILVQLFFKYDFLFASCELFRFKSQSFSSCFCFFFFFAQSRLNFSRLCSFENSVYKRFTGYCIKIQHF